MKRFLSICLKLIVMICAIWGVALCARDAQGFMGGKHVLLYFTTQSNLWMAVVEMVAFALLLTKRQPGRWYSLVQLIFTVSITLTGVVYCFVLAPTMPPAAAFSLANVLTHVIVPLAAITDFFVCRKAYSFRRWDALYSTLPAWYYLAFASIGYVLGWQFAEGINYPYFFLNWGSPAGAFGFADELPFIGVGYYILLILAFLIGIAKIYTATSRKHQS